MRDEDERIAGRAVEQGLLKREALDACRRTAEELRALGIEKGLLEIVVDHHHLTAEQAAGLRGGGRSAGDGVSAIEKTMNLAPEDLRAIVATGSAVAPAEGTLDLDASELAEVVARAGGPPAEAPAPAPAVPEEAPAEDDEEESAPPEPDVEDVSGSASGSAAPGSSVSGSTSFPSTGTRRQRATEMNQLTGETLGGCRLEEKLGQGAMGTVFRARHLALEKTVAVKLLNPSRFYEKRQVERFFREARSAASIEHQNIVSVQDVGQEKGLYYIVMQYIEGESLQDRIRREKKLSIEEAIRIAIDVAKGLSVAHGKGVVHRDVKPANILLTKEGEVKIADFGLAYRGDNDGTVTNGMEVLGTPAYMSPEQIDGRQVDHRADLYSLGVTLYYLTTGKKPFEGATPMEVLLKHMSERLVPPTQIDPRIPRALGQVIERLMAKDVENRYGSADELMKDLSEIRDGGKPKVVVAMEDYIQRMEELATETADPKSRHPLAAAVVSGLVAAVCAILFTVALPDMKAATPAFVAPGNPLDEEAGRAFAAADEFARQNPSALEEATKLLTKIATDYESVPPWPTKARSRIREIERRYDDLAREKTGEGLARASHLAGSGDPGAALLALSRLDPVWRKGAVGSQIEAARQRYLADLIRTTGMTFVPEGTFLAGEDRHEEHLPAFFVDVTEVSNRDYAKFVAATGRPAPPGWPDGRPERGREDEPVVGVTYEDAEAYATWLGKRLPTALEWEKAARGTDGRAYPWGEEFRQEAANCASLPGTGKLVPVTACPTGRSPFGCLNMAGNAFEWTSTFEPRTGNVVVKGGAHETYKENVRPWVSLPVPPDHADPARPVGFRCAKDP